MQIYGLAVCAAYSSSSSRTANLGMLPCGVLVTGYLRQRFYKPDPRLTMSSVLQTVGQRSNVLVSSSVSPDQNHALGGLQGLQGRARSRARMHALMNHDDYEQHTRSEMRVKRWFSVLLLSLPFFFSFHVFFLGRGRVGSLVLQTNVGMPNVGRKEEVASKGYTSERASEHVNRVVRYFW